MYQPTYKGVPIEKTEIRIAYDNNYIYAAGSFYDATPASMCVNSLYRNRTNNDDIFINKK